MLLVGVNACAATRTGPVSQEQPWPAYLGSSARVSPRAEPLSADPQPVWRTDVGRGIVGAPALAEEVVALSQVSQQVALLDRATGDVLWRARLRGRPAAGPLLADDHVFVATEGRGAAVVALRLVNGRQAWSARAGDVAAPLALEGGVLYAAATDGWVTALDAVTGRQRWRVRVTGGVRAAPLPLNGGILVATERDSLFFVDAAGHVTMRRGTPGTVLAAPALGGGRVLIATMAGRLAALDTATLEPAWTRELGGEFVGAVAVRGGVAWAFTGRGALWSVPIDSSAGARKVETGLVSRAGPLPAAQGIYVTAVDGRIMRLTEDGSVEWSVQVQAPLIEPPAQDGRMLIVASQRGEVVAFR